MASDGLHSKRDISSRNDLFDETDLSLGKQHFEPTAMILNGLLRIYKTTRPFQRQRTGSGKRMRG